MNNRLILETGLQQNPCYIEEEQEEGCLFTPVYSVELVAGPYC
jgi:hypothetical protein